MNGDQKSKAIQTETDWCKQDFLILELKQIKNDLEAYAYSIRSDLGPHGGPLRDFMDPNQVEAFIEEANKIVEFLYDEQASNCAKEVFVTKFDFLKNGGNPCKARRMYFEEAPFLFANF